MVRIRLTDQQIGVSGMKIFKFAGATELALGRSTVRAFTVLIPQLVIRVHFFLEFLQKTKSNSPY